ncbi:MAG: valine--tRNA ligase [Clostridiales bacterium]|nr:valine--tRNA ligase [Clostridiales bacterium]
MSQEFQMEKTFQPQEKEQQIYQEWERSGAFTAQRVEGKKPYTIVMPPPNITGQLHMGHAVDVTIQDILIRFHRMLGDPTLWLPGTDHASIATENRIVEQMRKEGLTKEGIGREAFLERAWEWKEKYGGQITQQLRRMGASCDWSRERFTMDAGCSRAVSEVFVKLFEQGLIYRGERIINWCPVCRTALSDIEVEYEEQHAHLWYIRYPAEDGGEGVVVATTRPETMLGDTGVAVNPEDKRYLHLIGKKLMLPLAGRVLPVVADAYVDPEFGTGAVKMTPAHDPNDFEISKRHNLAILRVMNDDGTMNEAAGADYQGLSAMDCRKLVLQRLKEQGYLVNTQDYTHSVGSCSRCHTTVEPLISEQWFLEMAPLAKPAIEAVREGQITFYPDRFAKTYFNWMENIRDWCISRQLWWGHRIPAWYCQTCEKVIVAREAPDTCPDCGSIRLHQDEDVLDTWFSSALWPFSTLGWPDQTEDLQYFYPTSTLATGYDIIFFWVARMIFSGIAHMGQVPFDTVLIHGIVRDEQGRKMSKSLGNGVDPLELIETYGADALRFSLVLGVAPGADMRVSSERSEAARNFANKVWNASRFVLMNLDGVPGAIEPKLLRTPEKWILSRLNQAIRQVTNHLKGNDLGLAAQTIYDFAWNEFCDWFIELSKGDLFDGTPERKAQARAVLYQVLSAVLRLLHPFMPFLTEMIYKQLPGHEQDSCMLSPWPLENEAYSFKDEEQQMEGVMDMIRAIRVVRQELKVQPGHRARVLLKPKPGWAERLTTAEPYFQRLAGAASLQILPPDAQVAEKTVSAVGLIGEALMPLGELVDIEKEIARLEKEAQTLEAEISRSRGKLANEGFVKKAPPALVEAEKEKIAQNEGMLETVTHRLRELRQ